MGDERKGKIWNYLISKGMTMAGAAGMMGNMYAESGLIPNRVEILLLNRYKELGITYTDASYTAAVDSGKIPLSEFLHPIKPTYQYGYGLCQWTSPSRKQGLYDLCKSKGKSIGNLDCQLAFLIDELKTSYKSVWQTLTTSNNVLNCAVKVLSEFEIPAEMGQQIQQQRYGYAMKYYDQFARTEYERREDRIESYVGFMEDVAADQTHGYSQENRWGTPDYDCSSLVITALEHAGIPVKSKGATYTGNMYNALISCGFKDITGTVVLSTGTGLQRGDVLMYHKTGNIGHTAVYVGGGKIVHARGRSYGSSAPGDQCSEIAVTPYNNPGWQYVLRYEPGGSVLNPTGERYMFSVELVKRDSKGASVKLMQTVLKGKGYKGKDKKGLTLDGEAGENTIYALMSFQKKAKLIVDGECGNNTWSKLLGL